MFKSLLIITALLSVASAAMAQTVSAPSYSWTPVSVPSTSLAAATSTNLASGWTQTVYTTNSQLAYSASSGSFVTNTTITTNTATVYANFSALGQKNVALQFEFAGNGATTTNLDITVARSVTGVNYDTANNQTFSFAFNGSTGVVGVTNLTMDGFGYGRIVTVFNRDSARTLTNLHVYQSVYKFRN